MRGNGPPITPTDAVARAQLTARKCPGPAIVIAGPAVIYANPAASLILENDDTAEPLPVRLLRTSDLPGGERTVYIGRTTYDVELLEFGDAGRGLGDTYVAFLGGERAPSTIHDVLKATATPAVLAETGLPVPEYGMIPGAKLVMIDGAYYVANPVAARDGATILRRIAEERERMSPTAREHEIRVVEGGKE